MVAGTHRRKGFEKWKLSASARCRLRRWLQPSRRASWTTLGWKNKLAVPMIIEQVRYFATAENVSAVVEARRSIDSVRGHLGLPVGHILVADPVPDDSPAVVWQCGYESETQLAMAEAAIGNSAEYHDARDRLGALTENVEIELYTIDEVEVEADDDVQVTDVSES
jgi:hypothetical protein